MSPREELLLRSRLGVAGADWERSGRSDDYLLHGGRLAQHEAWTATTQLPLSRDEKDLLERSRGATEEAATRRRRVRRGILAAEFGGYLLEQLLFRREAQSIEHLPPVIICVV